MQINYSLSKRDIFFARFVSTFQNKVLLIASILAICGLAFVISTGDEARKYSVGVRIAVAIVALGFAAIQYLLILLLLNLAFTYSSKLTGVIGWHRLEIKDEGLEESTDVDQSFHRWTASFRIREFGNYVWIYPIDSKFYLVPKNPKRCQGDLAGFLDELRKKSSHRPTAPPVLPR